MFFEGIVIHKTPYKESDLIIKLLLRNGLVGSFYIYGGQGGGKKLKPFVFDIGSMIKIMTRDQKSRLPSSDLMICSEYHRIWSPDFIRHDLKGFYLCCLYVELIQKISLAYQIGDDSSESEHEGVFSVLSNALFYLDEAIKKNIFQPDQHLTLFMIKFLFHLGIMPDTQRCCFCQEDLLEMDGVLFLPANGQFGCSQCSPGENDKGFLLQIKKGFQTKYQNYEDLQKTNFSDCQKFIEYFCHQYHLKPLELKSYSLLFK